MSYLARYLMSRVDIPVVDQTKLTNRYDFDIPTNLGTNLATRLEDVRQFLRHNFGLELISARQPHAVFVIKKAE